jgi:hypothetical protein
MLRLGNLLSGVHLLAGQIKISKVAKKAAKKAIKKLQKKSNTTVDRSDIPPNSSFFFVEVLMRQ